jgi:hypothetical protein
MKRVTTNKTVHENYMLVIEKSEFYIDGQSPYLEAFEEVYKRKRKETINI